MRCGNDVVVDGGAGGAGTWWSADAGNADAAGVGAGAGAGGAASEPTLDGFFPFPALLPGLCCATEAASSLPPPASDILTPREREREEKENREAADASQTSFSTLLPLSASLLLRPSLASAYSRLCPVRYKERAVLSLTLQARGRQDETRARDEYEFFLCEWKKGSSKEKTRRFFLFTLATPSTFFDGVVDEEINRVLAPEALFYHRRSSSGHRRRSLAPP